MSDTARQTTTAKASSREAGWIHRSILRAYNKPELFLRRINKKASIEYTLANSKGHAKPSSPWSKAGYPLTTTAALNELSWGTHEGIKPTTTQKQEFEQILKRWQQGHLEDRIEAGESPLDAWNRAQSFFQTLLAQPSPSQMLLCSHGRQLRVILSMLLGKGLQDMEPYRHGNTGLSVVRIQHIGQGELLKLNDASHLASLSHLT